MKPRLFYPGLACVLVAAATLATPAAVRAERLEPVSEQPGRGRVAVNAVGPEFGRPGTYYVAQGASLNDLFTRAGGVKDIAFVRVLIVREREGKTSRFSVPSKSLDLQFDFQEGDRVICPQTFF